MVPLLGEDTKDSRLPFGAYRGMDPCLLLGGLLLLLLLRLGLRRRRRRGGERLRDGLLLRLLPRLKRPASMLTSRLVVFDFIRSLRGERGAERPERGAGLIERERERDKDLERDLEIGRLLRDFGGGERLLDEDRERLRLRVGGERERELVEYDLPRRLGARRAPPAGEGERDMDRAGRRRAGGVTDPLGERRRRGGVLDLDMDLDTERFAGDGDLPL